MIKADLFPFPLDPPRQKNKETERALFQNPRNFWYKKQKSGKFKKQG